MEPTPTKLPRSVWVNHSEFEEAVHVGRTTARGPAVDAFRQDPKAHGGRYRAGASAHFILESNRRTRESWGFGTSAIPRLSATG